MALEDRRAAIREAFGLAPDADVLPEHLRGGWIEDDWDGNYVQFRRANPLRIPPRKLLGLPSDTGSMSIPPIVLPRN